MVENIRIEQSNHGVVFKTYLEALLEGNIDHVSDILELVESHYFPLITSDVDKFSAKQICL